MPKTKQDVTIADVENIANEIETWLNDTRVVIAWMKKNKVKKIHPQYMPSIERGKIAMRTGVRGLLEARQLR